MVVRCAERRALWRAVEEVCGERGRQGEARGGGAEPRPAHALADHAPAELHQRQGLGCNGIGTICSLDEVFIWIKFSVKSMRRCGSRWGADGSSKKEIFIWLHQTMYTRGEGSSFVTQELLPFVCAVVSFN